MHLDLLQGISFFIQKDDGTKLRAQVVKEDERVKKSKHVMRDFIIQYEKDDIDDIMTYNDIMNFIHMDRVKDEDYIWKFKTVLGHQGPLTPRHKHWKDSKYNVEIEWENGEITFKLLSKMKQDSPVITATYAKKHGLLDTDG